MNVNVRFPEPVRDRVRAFAQMDRRSMNSEIIELLEEAMNARAADMVRQSRRPAPAPPDRP